MSMIREYHNHKLQTNPLCREEEPHNNHETPGRQTKQSGIKWKSVGKHNVFLLTCSLSVYWVDSHYGHRPVIVKRLSKIFKLYGIL